MSKLLNFDKELSFVKSVSSFLAHLVLSLTVGPIIAVILFLLWLIALGQGSPFANFITEESLVGYWFVILLLLMFGLVWLEYFNNRKDASLSSLKCNRWWIEYWIFFKKQNEELIELPSEAEEHFYVKLVSMDKDLALILGSLILTTLSFVVTIIIYFTRDRVRLLLPNDLTFSDYQWIVGVFIFLLVGSIAFIICLVLLYRSFFKLNKDQYLWKRFWIGFLLYTLKNSHQDFSKFKEQSDIESFIESFKSKYSSLANEISNSLTESSLNLEFVAWLENKLEEVEQSPSILIPPSLSSITAFYGFALIIAGSFGNLIVGPATDLLRFISDFFL
ncbi:MAG: hypothetical protein ACW967_02535 [Candidatus Hodarchaeales archaeon]|jgi:hypothetical protein